jgi:hypothetical protein
VLGSDGVEGAAGNRPALCVRVVLLAASYSVSEQSGGVAVAAPDGRKVPDRLVVEAARDRRERPPRDIAIAATYVDSREVSPVALPPVRERHREFSQNKASR